MKLLSVCFCFLLLLVAPRFGYAEDKCVIPDFMRDREAWASVEKLKLARVISKDGNGVDAESGYCSGQSLSKAANNSDTRTCQLSPSNELWDGKEVVILKEYGEFSCITAARGKIDTYWVRKTDLKEQDVEQGPEIKWAGAYRRAPSAIAPGYSFDQIDISGPSAGKYLLSGGEIWSAAEIPLRGTDSCTSYTLMQIALQEVTPVQGTLDAEHVQVELDASSCNSQKELEYKEGRELPGCHLFFKKKGNFLFVREDEKCVYRPGWSKSETEKYNAGFQGIWLATSEELPSPRPNHAMNMMLGR